MNSEKQDTQLENQNINYDDLSRYGKFLYKLKEKLQPKTNKKRHKMVSYGKYGYLFLIPFFVSFLVFSFIPLCSTFFYSFFEYYSDLLDVVGPNFIGFKNFETLVTDKNFWGYFGNTFIIWIIGFIPQIIISLLLAVWFTDARLKLKFTGFFKAVMYMPNLVMASAFGLLFLMLFGQNGPINQILTMMGHSPYAFTESTTWTRIIIAMINWIMWFGNTTILLMSGIMGIDESIFESARLDGSSGWKTFIHITFPLLLPIFVYVFITSLIGGIQLFDAAQIFTRTKGGPEMSGETIMMYLYALITSSKNYGLAGAVSVILFVLTGILSLIIFKVMVPTNNVLKQEAKAKKARERHLNYAIAKENRLQGGIQK